MTTRMKRTATMATALALVAGAALVASPAALAAPAPGAFTTPTIGGLPGSITLPTSGAKEYSFTVSFSGTPSDGGYTDVNGDGAGLLYYASDENFGGPTATPVSTVAKSYIYKPSLTSPSTIVPGTSGGFKLRVSYYTTPGVYRVSVPVTQRYYPSIKTTRWATVQITINANAKASKATTSYYAPSWKVGKTAKVSVSTNEYQNGAKVTLYYKKNGTKKYKAVVSGKLKKSGSYSKVTLKTKKMTKSGKVYLKVGKVKFAPSYKTKTVKITVRRTYR